MIVIGVCLGSLVNYTVYSTCICAHTQVQSHPDTHITHFAIGSFAQHCEKLKTIWANPLTVSVDTLTGQLHLLRLDTETTDRHLRHIGVKPCTEWECD